jgi:hypothetical protein
MQRHARTAIEGAGVTRVFIFFRAALALGSPTALFITAMALSLVAVWASIVFASNAQLILAL